MIAFAAQLPHPEDPDQLIADTVKALYSVEVPVEELSLMKTSILLSGLTGMASDHYWTNAWQNLQLKPDDRGNRNNVTNKLKALFRHLMDKPEYQLM